MESGQQRAPFATSPILVAMETVTATKTDNGFHMLTT